MGVYTLGIIFFLVVLSFILVLQISKKPILNQGSNESVKESLKAGLLFVFNDKVILGALTLDMIAVLFGGAVAIFAVFAKDAKADEAKAAGADLVGTIGKIVSW